jgi:hypothetical protein
MSEIRCTSTRKPVVGDTVIDRAFSDLYGVDKATPMKVTRIFKQWRDGVDELEVTLTRGTPAAHCSAAARDSHARFAGRSRTHSCGASTPTTLDDNLRVLC